MAATHIFANSFIYEETDVPEGVTLREWRRSVEPADLGRLQRAVELAKAVRVPIARPKRAPVTVPVAVAPRLRLA
jgi:hypothetical protein